MMFSPELMRRVLAYPIEKALKSFGYLPVRRNARALVFICPFHAEKTASFRVNRRSNQYLCQACGAGGSVVRIYKEFENIADEMTAIAHVAHIIGISSKELRLQRNVPRQLTYAERMDADPARWRAKLDWQQRTRDDRKAKLLRGEDPW